MRQTTSYTALILLAAVAAPAAASLPAEAETSYGYLRTVEGPGRIAQAVSGARVDVEANYPVLAGDLLEVDPGGRLELSLPDFNIVRLDGGSELLLDRLALSAETEDQETALRLLRGELQFLVQDLLAVAERPRVDTANATIYLQGSGLYRIATDGYGWTEVVVRRGFAEIATEAGSSVVRAGEQAWIEGGRWPRIDIDRAGEPDDLERWGSELDGELTAWNQPPVEDHLAYSAAPLERHGSWVTDDGYRAWRPAVNAAWRPYETGYWTDTPTGMVWVSSEPWAWVTYHYGSWVPSPSYGWVWRPGIRFAPAWVYWYWGPSYVAWVPVGYYARHYGHYGRGFRFGVHGWAGGNWGYFADWTFCSTRDYRRRDLRHHVRRGDRLARDTRSRALERGLISTDSRREARQRAALRSGPGRDELPDVTAFVARQRQLPAEVTERVFSDRRAVARDGREWERPERPSPEAQAARADARRTRTAAPRARGAERSETWRDESGRVRPGNSPTATRAQPRTGQASSARPGARRAGDSPAPRAVTPRADRSSLPRATTPRATAPRVTAPRATAPQAGDSAPPRAAPRATPPVRPVPPDSAAAERSRWWEERAGRAAPRSAAPAPESWRDRSTTRSAVPRGLGDQRPPVVRRVWEGIRDSQRARPSAAPPPPGATTPRPGSDLRSSSPRRPPAARSAPPSRRPPAAQPRSAPRQRPSTQSRSAPQRRQPSTRSGSRGGSRSSSARSSQRSSSRSSSGDGARGRSARRRPPE